MSKKLSSSEQLSFIELSEVHVHNLKGVSVKLPKGKLIAFCGVSGSGKSSLAFDTLYREGQRQYLEAMSLSAQKALGGISRPDVKRISGITPTVAIEQKTTSYNLRSTVGTLTEIYDFLRVVYARISTAHCPESGDPLEPLSPEEIADLILDRCLNRRILLIAPVVKEKKGLLEDEIAKLERQGFVRARLDGNFFAFEETPDIDPDKAHTLDVVIDRLAVKKDQKKRLNEAIAQALEVGLGVFSVVDHETTDETLYSTLAYSKASGLSYPPLNPTDFSFNSTLGMCPRCSGLGHIQSFLIEKIIDPEKSIAEDCCIIAPSMQTVRYGNIYKNLSKLYDFSLNTPWKDLTQKAQNVFLNGIRAKWTRMHFVHPETKKRWVDYVRFDGILKEAEQRYVQAKSDSYKKNMEKLMGKSKCPDCLGARIRPYPAHAKLESKTIHELTNLPIEKALDFLEKLKLPEKKLLIGDELLKEVKLRLGFLKRVGLGYMTLARAAPTLSGGEAQRVRLASHLGSGLVDITYVLDEPTIGLHPQDNEKLIETLSELRNRGNTVIVVEHDEQVLLSSDHVVEIGPGAGIEGGLITFEGPPSALIEAKNSPTAEHLKKVPTFSSEQRKINLKKTPFLELKGVQYNNLKNVNLRLPLGKLSVVTGVSGSGKSSLIIDSLKPALTAALDRKQITPKELKGHEHIDKLISIDQSPIGRTPRSNPATYTKLFDAIRDLYTQLPESRARGYDKGRFSFNVKEGSCLECSGVGQVRIDMDFMEEAWVLCPGCSGKRFDSATLSILYKGKNIYDVLSMSVREALEHFSEIPPIRDKLQLLNRVGLGYIKIGQPSTTLSGGEAQRIKLAKELVKRASTNTLYILDEPTVGLHFRDVDYLMTILEEIRAAGNTVVIIEHNLDVIMRADYALELGPKGGDLGGEIIAACTPYELCALKTPTGLSLKSHIKPTTTKGLRLSSIKEKSSIEVRKASIHNLKQVDIDLPRGELIAFSGPSGCGKSSLAFNTIYAEGQRRYTETLPAYARQFLKQMPKPPVERIDGLAPAIAIEQKSHGLNPRSTVGTMSEVYDYLRLLYVHAATPHCPKTGEKIEAISKESVVEKLLKNPPESKLTILAPIDLKKRPLADTLESLKREGYLRIRLNGNIYRLDEPIDFDEKKKNTLEVLIDRIRVSLESKKRLFEAIEHAALLGKDKLLVERTLPDKSSDKDLFFNLAFAAPSTGEAYPELNHKSFSFNTKEGICLECMGLGYTSAKIDEHSFLMDLSPEVILHSLWQKEYETSIRPLIPFFELTELDLYSPLKFQNPKAKDAFLNGSSISWKWGRGRLRWKGLSKTFDALSKWGKSPLKGLIAQITGKIECPECHGERLNPLARAALLDGISIGQLSKLPLDKALSHITNLKLSREQAEVLKDVRAQITSRLRFMIDIGIGYLALGRGAPTLSGGELQRLRLSRQLGSDMGGAIYVLDEPSIGLHPSEVARVMKALEKLKALNNTVLMVEHDPIALKLADRLIDMGPEAGALGGQILAHGPIEKVLKDPNSKTAAYLTGKKQLSSPALSKAPAKKESKKWLKIENARIHNLKGITCEIAAGQITCLVGPSGSGKSTLVDEVIVKAFEKSKVNKASDIELPYAQVEGLEHFGDWVYLDQNPIGQTTRADIATYVDLLTPLRAWFARLPEAQMRGLAPKNFSYYHKSGMCKSCYGFGYKTVQLQFMPPVKVICDGCKGQRLGPLSLNVKYEGLNLAEHLAKSAEEALKAFGHIPKATRALETLIDVGLGHLPLNRETATLSGGEAQRLRLSRDLSKKKRAKTLYIFDEPTIGLHFEDVEKLLGIFFRLRSEGHTLLIVEHNTDVIRFADQIIELGPGAGALGGEITAKGTLQSLGKNWMTGAYL